MRLLHDVGLLDSVITPVTADAIFTGVQHGAEELTPPQVGLLALSQRQDVCMQPEVSIGEGSPIA
jgi:hypothetical protein